MASDPQPPVAPSKQRILDAAEELFASRGFAATSLRAVTTQADVNLAAVHYHFGSKDGLIEAVLQRNLAPINQQRLAMLEQCTDAAPRLEDILEAFVVPALRVRHAPGGRGDVLLRLYGRTHVEPGFVRQIFMRQFGAVKDRFRAAFRRALPGTTQLEVAYKMHFVIGVVAQTLSDPDRLRLLSDGAADPDDVEATWGHLLPFLVAGMRAAGGSRRRRRKGGR